MSDEPLTFGTLSNLLAERANDSGGSTYLVTMDRECTYEEAHLQSRRLATELALRGVQPRDHVAVCMENSLEMMILIHAIHVAGAVAVLLNPELRAETIQYMLDDSAPSLVVCDSHRQHVLMQTTYGNVTLVFDHDTLAGEKALPSLTELGESEVKVLTQLDPWDSAVIMYTSGTTGLPKGVIITHAHLLTLGAAQLKPLALTPKDRFFVFLPLFHAMALATSVVGAMLCKGSAAIVPKFSASKFWSAARALDVTVFCAAASILEILQNSPVHEDENKHSVRAAYSVPLPRDPHGFEDRFSIPLATGYAMTETPPISNGVAGSSYHDPSQIGQVRSEFVEVRIADDQDLLVEAGQVGQILVRPVKPWTGAATYLNKPEATLEAHRNLWFHTGDLGRLEGDTLYFEGRAKEAIRRRGEFISPTEVENALLRFEHLQDAAAFAVPAELGEDEVCAAIVWKGNHPQNAELLVHEFAAEQLPKFMVPRYIVLVEELPRTATGKVERVRLSREYSQSMQKLWDATEVKSLKND